MQIAKIRSQSSIIKRRKKISYSLNCYLFEKKAEKVCKGIENNNCTKEFKFFNQQLRKKANWLRFYFILEANSFHDVCLH